MKILVCDDHTLFLSGLIQIFHKINPDLEILTLNNSEDCKIYLQKNRVDIFFCDLNIDNSDGFTLLQELKVFLIETKVIILTAYYENYLIEKAQKMGVNAYLKKESSIDDLRYVIEMPLDALFYTNKKKYSTQNEFLSIDTSIAKKFLLTRQEKEIVKHIIKGETSQEIADKMCISKFTVETHRRNILRKLQLDSPKALIAYAYENDLMD